MSKRSDTALVIPSIRQDSFERFLREWTPTGLFDRVDLILMEDNPKKTFKMDLENGALEDGRHVHLCWEDIDQKSWSHIIPRRSDTVRSFGYWYAYDKGYEYLMTLDDDCYPNPDYPNIDEIHKSMLTRTRWFNTLNNVRPRGVPYYNLGERKVYVNHGIWTGILDYDAPQQLVSPVPEVYTHDNRIVPHGSYHPFCGMNAMWRREVMVLSYHLLMGQMLPKYDGFSYSNDSHVKPNIDAFPVIALDKLPFDRFGDIWCGIIQKKICDSMNYPISTGTPYIHHDRASSPFTNLRKEANGIEVNEWLWGHIDMVPMQNHWTVVERYKVIGSAIRAIGLPGLGKPGSAEHREYWAKLGNAMITWAELFES